MTVSAYLASTPLHILNSIAIADTSPGQHHLLIIDQPEVTDNIYYKLLAEWPDSPFTSLAIYPGRIKGSKDKLQQRRKIFAELERFAKRDQPTQVYTGNDRRIEFQYLMHVCSEQALAPHGYYMDEGTFTYVGRKASSGFGDKVIDNLIKKLTYGFWWSNPPTVGGSHWIQTVYAAFPELVIDVLKSKEVRPLAECYRDSSAIGRFAARFLQHFSFDQSTLTGTDLLITTPHESLIEKISGYREMLVSCIEQATAQGKRVAVKYHPRNIDPDILGFANHPLVKLIPAAIPFELICPMMQDVVLVGDLSSTLINASWLTPDVKVLALQVHSGASEFDRLFQQLGIPVIPPAELGQALTRI
ncbi:alpha-2,8-polysialyltransferase family protein [Oceanobacter mangrovi]|uniref:alpha-2,8-polysialyltransferase family protein n=1 Tax=Oceanobacter mangrovi TaxID=2862510 RepID=UPI001C8E4EA4|nr:alpha-2,8-polysialyltransferase family protein [Oceanobacter mangrovi]